MNNIIPQQKISSEHIDHHWIKAKAQELGVTVPTLFVGANNADPFYTGTSTQIRYGQWVSDVIADLKDRGQLDGRFSVHDLHYAISTGGKLYPRPDAKGDYLNTPKDEAKLNEWVRHARNLGQIAHDTFIDKRATVFSHAEEYDKPTVAGVSVSGYPEAPTLPFKLPSLPSLEGHTWPTLSAEGYETRQYVVDIFLEKDSSADLINDICLSHGANLTITSGHATTSAVWGFVKRVQQAGRAGRLLYISDYDSGGFDMVATVATKIAHLMNRYDEFANLDIKLVPIAVTRKQVDKLGLSTGELIIKKKGGRKWLANHGNLICEINSFITRRDELGAIVTQALVAYHDSSLSRRVDDAHREAVGLLKESNHTGRSREAITLNEEYGAIYTRYDALKASFAKFIKPMQDDYDAIIEELANLDERYEAEHEAIADELANLDVNLDSVPVPQPIIEDEPDAVFSSDMAYLEMVDSLKRFKEFGV